MAISYSSPREARCWSEASGESSCASDLHLATFWIEVHFQDAVLPLEKNTPRAGRPDGRELYVSALSGAPHQIFRIDVTTGRRTLWKELHPSQKAGVRLSQVSITPDGRTVLHSYSRLLSNLYVVSGISTKAR